MQAHHFDHEEDMRIVKTCDDINIFHCDEWIVSCLLHKAYDSILIRSR